MQVCHYGEEFISSFVLFNFQQQLPKIFSLIVASKFFIFICISMFYGFNLKILKEK